MNQNILEGKWKEFKGVIRETWGQLTDDEIEQTKGNLDQLAGKLQKKYGYRLEEARSVVNSLFKKINNNI